MEFYAELFKPIMPHLNEHLEYYLCGIPILLVFLYFTRRYSIPLILYTVEFCIYSFAVHTFIHVVVSLFSWFKNSSSMKALQADGMPLDAVYWTTPWTHFWLLESYNPRWIVWLECTFLVVIVALMYRFRPFSPQYKRKKKNVPPPPPKRGKGREDDWGTPKRHYGVPSSKTAGNGDKK